MKNITPMQIIRAIAGDVSVEYDEIVAVKGGGAYDEQRRVIKLANPVSTSGHNLALCAHEAFHARRHQEGVLMYDLPRNLLRLPLQLKEEEAVNDRAEAYLHDLPLSPEQRREAAELFVLSRQSYRPRAILQLQLNAAVGVTVLRLQGWAQRRDGRRWTCWDECQQMRRGIVELLEAPGIPVDDDGELRFEGTLYLWPLLLSLLILAGVPLPEVTSEQGI